MAGNDANTVFLLHSDTTNGSTTFGDDGVAASCPHEPISIRNSSTQHSTDHAKFGATAVRVSYVSGLDTGLTFSFEDFQSILNDAFTVDCWFWKDYTIGSHYVFKAVDSTGDNLIQIILGQYGVDLSVDCYNFSTKILELNISDISATLNAWNHLECVRSGSSFLVFLNGSQIGTTQTFSGSFDAVSPDYTVSIGSSMVTYNRYAYFDEYRISDIARHTSAFTPPSDPYSAPAPEEVVTAVDGATIVLSSGGMQESLSIVSGAHITLSPGVPIVPFISLVDAPGNIVCSPCTPWVSWSIDEAVARTIYLFTLTGAPDGQSDITIPVSSIQGRLRNGEPTYLSVVVPSSGYAADIALRPNGEMSVQRGVRLSDGAVQLEEIARVTLEDIRLDEGARNQSITLSGHSTVSNSTPKTVTLIGASYRNVQNGSLRYRCAVNNFLRPGDTALINGETLIVNTITYTIGVSSEVMEIAEAS